ncbi:MAG: MFS transporter, partial [Bdellovibrionales bacterium]|nr:MFS transporter [Bdellovibrionales bacterium]
MMKPIFEKYPKNFRPRRGLNWGSLGLLYGTYYMCRYNFRFAVPGLQEEYGFDIESVSWIFAIWSVAYGTGQLINGLFTDSLGGKKGMLVGAVGTIIINFIFGFSPWVSGFSTFAMLALLNGYFQSFGAPGMVKINAAWFQKRERGSFAGIFGGMIQLGQISISRLAPWILNYGIMIGGIVLAESGQWRYLFRLP